MEEKNPLKIEVRCTVKDIFRYNLWVAYKNWTNKAVSVVGLGLIVYFIYQLMHTTETLDIFIAQNLIILLLGLFLFAGQFSKVWKITLAQMQTPALAKGTTYTFTNEKIYLTLKQATEEIDWEVYVKVVETKNDFRFFIDAVQAQLIPKHCMNKEELSRLKEMIKETMPEEKRQLKA